MPYQSLDTYYTVRALATWKTYCEHPSGSRHPDIRDTKTRTLDIKVRAINIDDARRKARQQIEIFKIELPDAYDTGNSGSSEPVISDVEFAKIHKL